VAAALLATVAACKGQPPAKKAAGKQAAGKQAAVPLKPVAVEPAPACDLGAEPASRPRGVIIALYHTANVVGEVEPCG
jgi:hypothetical protein